MSASAIWKQLRADKRVIVIAGTKERPERLLRRGTSETTWRRKGEWRGDSTDFEMEDASAVHAVR